MPKRGLHRRPGRVTAFVSHIHLSGKFNRSAHLLRAQVLAAAQWADVITLTEVNYADRGDVLEAIDGWTLLRGHDGPQGESAILVRSDTWRVHRWATHLLSDTVPAARNRVVVVIALLEHVETGLTLLLSAGHMPASVEKGWRARTARVKAHISCVLAWRRLVRDWWRRRRPDGGLIVADWNLNLLRTWVRDWARRIFRAWRPPTPGDTARSGDLGRRLISWAIGRRLSGLKLRVSRRDPASDHRGIRLTYTIRPRRKKEHQ